MQLVQALHYDPESCVLEFLFDLILPATLWPQSRLSVYPPRKVCRRVKAAGAMTDNFHVPFVWKSGSLNLLERAGRVQASIGIAVTLLFAREEDPEVQCSGFRPDSGTCVLNSGIASHKTIMLILQG
jgi:hypothetical protein